MCVVKLLARQCGRSRVGEITKVPYFRSLRFHLAGTCERTVNFTHDCELSLDIDGCLIWFESWENWFSLSCGRNLRADGMRQPVEFSTSATTELNVFSVAKWSYWWWSERPTNNNHDEIGYVTLNGWTWPWRLASAMWYLVKVSDDSWRVRALPHTAL